MRNRIRSALESDKESSNEFVESDNAENILELLEKERPDLLILDLSMPNVNGMEALKLLNEKGIDLSVLIVSADIQKVKKEKCLALGAKGFVNKPFIADELRTIVRGVLK